MKSLTLSLLLLFTALALHAQDSYRKEKMNVMGVTYSGFSTTVPFSEVKAKQYLSTYLKSNGRISEKRNFIEIKETYWKNREDLTKVYALVAGDSLKSRIWIGYSPEATETLTTAIEGEMQNLPAIMQKHDLQQQIKDAEDAASYLSKEIKNSERDQQRLQNRLEQNAEEKIKLEQALVQNGKDKIQLEQDIIDNDKTKEDKTQALDEVKKQLEYLKERLLRL